MLSYRLLNGITGGALVLALIACWTGMLPWVAVFIIVGIHLTLVAWGSMDPALGMFIQHRLQGTPGTMALTYDDGPHPEYTPALLDLLHAEEVKATFFCIGRNVEAHPAIVRRMVEEGHAVGIHTQDHRWSWGFLNAERAAEQISRCAEAIRKVAGTTPRLFRPPFGVTSPGTAAGMRRTGVQPIGWDLRTFDTNASSTQQVLDRVAQDLDRGSILLMHDTLPFTVELTAALIRRCREHGTRLVKLEPLP